MAFSGNQVTRYGAYGGPRRPFGSFAGKFIAAGAYFMPGVFRLHIRKANQLIPVTLVDATDGYTLETGVTSPTIRWSKPGSSAYAVMNDGTWDEIGRGDYTVRADETDSDTAGLGILSVVATGVSRETKIYVLVGIDAAEETTMAENIRKLRTEKLK